MSGQDSQLSRVYRNVFGGQGLQANLGNLAKTFQEGSKSGRDIMGCTWSGLSALYDAVNSGQEIEINGRRFRIIQTIGEGGYAFVYLVKEVGLDPSPAARRSSQDGSKKYISDDGTYALKKFLIQTREQMQMVKAEVDTASKFNHSNLLPLLEHTIMPVQQGTREAYLLFPVYPEGTLQDHIAWMTQGPSPSPSSQHPSERIGPYRLLHITRQIAAGLAHMHAHDPPYAHNDMKPGNVLISTRRPQQTPSPSAPAPPVSVAIMDFGSACPARRQIRTRNQALSLQEWAAQQCSAAYRAPEFWDCPSEIDVDERSDVWSLGCTLFALMYGQSPFEFSLGEAGGSLQLAVMSGTIKWPPPVRPPYPQALHELVTWMVQLDVKKRPFMPQVVDRIERMLAKLPPSSPSQS